jgi:hypothetical protein
MLAISTVSSRQAEDVILEAICAFEEAQIESPV